ncbi:hypothetical protein NL676_017232 [Syzygium grande]|nr:hypothetical protein NL676_017232 [Syzygium grande]
MELGGSFRLQGGRPFSKLGRPNSSLLLSESITAECARAAGYERLSESTRLSTDPAGFGLRQGGGGGGGGGRARGRVASFLTRVFSFVRAPAAGHDGRREAEECGAAKAIKKRSSWLPDPDRRWPVQGW